mmetsp:Transcript_97432/g.231845  ORF Transcript_97432/g.231845 Transcript_97432/m.231845 type:complete len:364 (-) Transcript_97432:37-1128(-)
MLRQDARGQCVGFQRAQLIRHVAGSGRQQDQHLVQDAGRLAPHHPGELPRRLARAVGHGPNFRLLEVSQLAPVPHELQVHEFLHVLGATEVREAGHRGQIHRLAQVPDILYYCSLPGAYQSGAVQNGHVPRKVFAVGLQHNNGMVQRCQRTLDLGQVPLHLCDGLLARPKAAGGHLVARQKLRERGQHQHHAGQGIHKVVRLIRLVHEPQSLPDHPHALPLHGQHFHHAIILRLDALVALLHLADDCFQRGGLLHGMFHFLHHQPQSLCHRVLALQHRVLDLVPHFCGGLAHDLHHAARPGAQHLQTCGHIPGPIHHQAVGSHDHQEEEEHEPGEFILVTHLQSLAQAQLLSPEGPVHMEGLI